MCLCLTPKSSTMSDGRWVLHDKVPVGVQDTDQCLWDAIGAERGVTISKHGCILEYSYSVAVL